MTLWLLFLSLFPFLTWTTPRTWVPGELVTATMMNTHVRDNINSLRSEHFTTQSFRGLCLRTAPDSTSASRVCLTRAEEIVMNDGSRLTNWPVRYADITVSGAGGLDTGAEAASTWYEVLAIAKDDGTRSLMLKKARAYFLGTVTALAAATASAFRDNAARAMLAQGFQLAASGTLAWADIIVVKVGTIGAGSIWVEIQSDTAGSPSGTVLATSDKIAAAEFVAGAVYTRFTFREPATLTNGVQYHVVYKADYSISASNFLQIAGDTVNSYAGGVAKAHNGTAWSTGGVAASVLDLYAALFIEATTTPTLPSGYTKYALVGYVFNNSSQNFHPFQAVDRRVTQGQMNSGSFANAAPVLYDLASIVPPVQVEVFVSTGNSTAANYVLLMPTFEVTGFVRSVGWAAFSDINSVVAAPPFVVDRYRNFYVSIGGGGTAQIIFWGYRW